MDASERFNPFPGLRPFQPEEDHLFFGREREVDELLKRLRTTRFVAVVGASGSGKSSLVRSGLVPSLRSGFMVRAGSSWRVAVLRPGEDPIGNLAEALNGTDCLGEPDQPEEMSRMIREATLRRSARGLSDCVREARVPDHENILVLVDQFEELFRFKKNRAMEHSRDEAVAFVKLLLEGPKQDEVPVYVVLTMRSDFIGDCMEYPGLPQAINEGQYLVPRMTRDELRLAITGPVAVGGGKISPRLVVRLLNDVGDDPDQLPILQHALMRTWDRWMAEGGDEEPIDLRHYEAIGTMREALSHHADEAYAELDSERARQIAESVFKALTDTTSDVQGIRRPTRLRTLSAITDADIDEVIAVVERFRRPGRSFLMPPAAVTLGPNSILDISHESLMRVWKRLIEWSEEEKRSAETYRALAAAATRWEEGTGGLWRDPELEIALKWREQQQPTAAWARQYSPDFELSMRFLDESERARDREIAEQRRERRRKLRRAYGMTAILAIAALLTVGFYLEANQNRRRAESNLMLARQAVDEMLTRVGDTLLDDVPQVERVRERLLDRARLFYEEFAKQSSHELTSRLDVALAHRRLGDIRRQLGEHDRAEREYGAAIDQLQALIARSSDPIYRRELARTHKQLGEVLRVTDKDRAKLAYDRALEIQHDLVAHYPDSAAYKQELARTYYNRGIVLAESGQRDSARADYEEAIESFESLIARTDDSFDLLEEYRQELARSYNNLAEITEDMIKARQYYERAIAILEDLIETESDRLDYKRELAIYYNNLANLPVVQSELAIGYTDSATKLLNELARPIPAVDLELGNIYNTLGLTLWDLGRALEADSAFRTALKIWQRQEVALDDSPLFHARFGYTLLYLAWLHLDDENSEEVAELLSRAVEHHLETFARSDEYADFCVDYADLEELLSARDASMISPVLQRCEERGVEVAAGSGNSPATLGK